MSVFAPYFDSPDPNIRNTAMLLETAEQALDDGEIDRSEFGALADDLLDLLEADGVLLDQFSETQKADLIEVTNSLKQE